MFNIIKSLKQQTEAKIAEARRAKPEFMKSVDDLIKRAKGFQQGSDAPKIGQQAPRFDLPNQETKPISLDEFLTDGPIVVTFYRGDWCPYCNLQFKALHDCLGDIQKFGAQLVAISPQVPNDSVPKNEISNMGFQVLSDQDCRIAMKYGVAWEVPIVLLDHMRVDRQLDLEHINGGHGSVLPIPATFVINKEVLLYGAS